MIVTLTLNPAVDVSMTIDRLVPEQKLRCSKPRYDAGGGGINVSKAIHRLGGDSLALFTSGGPTGLNLQRLVEMEGIDYQIIRTGELTRESFVVTETTTNHQYRFGAPGPTLSPAEGAAFLAHLEQLPASVTYLVASGSLPPGLPVDFYAQIGRFARARNLRYVLDTSGEPLKHALTEGVFLIKPNVNELARLLNTDKLEGDEVAEAARTLIGTNQCEAVAVSLGPQGAMLVTAHTTDFVPAPTVKKQSTVGAGDSLVGGMVYALAQGQSFGEAIRLGVACGTAATMNAGTELFHKADAERLLAWIQGR